MRLLRNLIHARPHIAMFILAMTLCVKALVPSGYMVMAGETTITVGLCSGFADGPQAATITIPIDKPAPGDPAHKGKSETPCAFTALSMASMSGADAPLLALALVFVMAVGLVARTSEPQVAAFRLLPPSQGPPAPA